jgi:aminopeptidase
MPDPRVSKLAQVLVHYSLGLQPGLAFGLQTSPLAQELTLAVYKEAILAGAHVSVINETPGQNEIFLRYASDAQLDHVSPILRLMTEQFDAALAIGADHNTRELAGIDPERQARRRRAQADIGRIFMERAARGELNWCYTVFPTQAAAQEADMGLMAYQDFVYGAGLLEDEDPIASWRAIGKSQDRLVRWLADRDQVILRGENIDLRLSIKERGFISACGQRNFPDGEIYTSPQETSAEGWVRFSYPAIYGGQEVSDIELWFQGGRVIKESAGKGQELLTTLLDSDSGARTLGELGIGTNYGIQRFTKNMLFDEKMGGTIHLAMGRGFAEIGGQNQSGLHWDMLCDMANGEILVDDELLYQNGRFIID